MGRIVNEAKELAEVTTTEYDGLFSKLADAIIAAAYEYMDLDYEEGTSFEEYFDGGVSILFLSRPNVSNVVIEEDGSEVDSTLYTVYPGGKIKLNQDTMSIWPSDQIEDASKKAVFANGYRNIKVTYDAGYSEEDLPNPLRYKLVKQVAYEFRRRKDLGLRAVVHPDGTLDKMEIGEWLPDVEAALKRKRKIEI